ncbi:MAG: cation-translocating P-type ATPase [Alcaligenaceae bacterium]|nr:cation-translocating P-type ATPase [Alcaligenaceae bacterium]
MAKRNHMKDPSIQSIEEIVQAVSGNPDSGLDSAQASERLHRDGPNALRQSKTVSAWQRFLAQFQDPLVYLLLFAIAISLVAWGVEGFSGWPIDALVILIIVMGNSILGFAQENKAENAVAALAKMTQVTSAVLRDGVVSRIPSTNLVVGDILMLEEGDAVGADARLLRASALKIQESSLTGESEAILKHDAQLNEVLPLGDRLNMVFKGTAIVQGTGKAIVTATGMDTEMGSIAQMLDQTVDEVTPLQKEIGHIGRMLGKAVVAIAIVVVITVLLMSEINSASDVISILLLGVSLAVAAVPEGLPAILSLVLAVGVQKMAKRNAIVKKLSSVETLGSATVICSDKTGTLTRSEMTIVKANTASGSTTVSGVGYVPDGAVTHEGKALEPGGLQEEQIVLLSGGSLANNADLRLNAAGEWEIQGDPTEAAFLVAEQKFNIAERRKQRFERVKEIPFSSERKMMSTIEKDHEHDGRLVLMSKGAPDVLLSHCTHCRVGTEVVEFTKALRNKALEEVERLSDAAYRTLSVAYRPLADNEDIEQSDFLEENLVFVGTVGIIDPPREEAAIAIQEAQRAGIRVVMITGDHPRTAARIGQELGIISANETALTGQELDKLNEEAFRAAVSKVSVFARVAPVHKQRIVDVLQAQGQIVAMTGDGVNDAPALKSADIGIAMGVTGTEVTKEAGKMILADDNFATIVSAVREGRNIFDNIRKFLRYLLSSNMGEVLTVFLGVVGAGVLGLYAGNGGIVVPLLATQILWINLITDSAPALAMGLDPETEDVMARKPRRPTERTINGRMWLGVFLVGLVMSFATLFTIDFYLPGGMIEGNESLDLARTAGFTVLVFAQLFNCFNARSELSSAFTHMFVNPWLLGAIVLSVLLQIAVVHLEFLNIAFNTVPLTLGQWGMCILMGSTVLWFSEIRKLFLRMMEK